MNSASVLVGAGSSNRQAAAAAADEDEVEDADEEDEEDDDEDVDEEDDEEDEDDEDDDDELFKLHVLDVGWLLRRREADELPPPSDVCLAVSERWLSVEFVVFEWDDVTLTTGIVALRDCNDKDELLRLNGGRDMTRWRWLIAWKRPYVGAMNQRVT